MCGDAEVTLWRRGLTAVLATLLFVVVPGPGVAGATDISGTCAGALHTVFDYDYDARVNTADGGGTDEAEVGLSSGTDGCGAIAASSDVGDIYASVGSQSAPRLLPNQVADAVDFRNLRFSDTAANHATTRPYVDSPLTLQEIVRGADPIPDPGGLPNGWRWDVPGSRARSGSYTDGSRNTTPTTRGRL